MTSALTTATIAAMLALRAAVHRASQRAQSGTTRLARCRKRSLKKSPTPQNTR